MRLTNSVSANAPKNRGMLIFHRLGNNYYLAQIWTPGSAEGREMLKSKAERAAEQEGKLADALKEADHRAPDGRADILF